MYDDIINTKYPFSLKKNRMSMDARCAQFMPFSALAGYSDAVNETARITQNRVILDDELKEILDNKLNKIKESFEPIITFTYFVSDLSKEGGSYKSITGIVKKIDLYKNVVIMGDNTKIPIGDIVDITGDIFNFDDV